MKHLLPLIPAILLSSCGPTTYVEQPRPVIVERPVYENPVLVEPEPVIVREGIYPEPVIVERGPEIIERERIVRGRRRY